MPEKTYWNGLETPAVRGTAVVADTDLFPQYWARHLVGQRIPVVRVTLDGVNYGGGVEYLDDRDGTGWKIVTRPKEHFTEGYLEIEPGSFISRGAEVQS